MANQNNQSPAQRQADEAAKKVAEAEKAAATKAAAAAKKGKLAVAVNLVTQTGADGKREDVLPGTVFEPAEVDVEFLTKAKAIREPNEAELALYEQVQRSKAAATATADETLG